MKKVAFKKACKLAGVDPAGIASVKCEMMDSVLLDVDTAERWYRLEVQHLLPDVLPLALKAVDEANNGKDVHAVEASMANILGGIVGHPVEVRIIPTDIQ